MAGRLINIIFGSAVADALVAGFAALAVAFVAWAMPNDLFSDLIGMSGLPAILSAAQPPLGETARLLTMAILAGAVFVLLFALLRVISYRPARSRPASRRPQAASEPRLRRADAHPDAPWRAPILAMTEFGAPIPPPAPQSEAELEKALLAALGDPQKSAADEEKALWAEIMRDDAAPATSPADEEKALWAEIMRATPEGDEGNDPFAPDVDELVLSAPFEPEPEPEPGPRLAPPVEAVRESRVSAIRGNESITELMQRLEAGLSRLAGSNIPVDPPVTAAPADDRLRSAIEDLQRLSARN